jgi:hypothetical protein
MTQAIKDVERRLRQVETELAELKRALKLDDKTPWYRQIAGSFAQDPVFAEITRLGRLIRKGKLKV